MSLYIGEFAALSSAFLWAIGSLLYAYAGRDIPAMQLNFFKGVLGGSLALITLILSQQTVPTEPIVLLLLLLSGAIGIGLGDTTYFMALNMIGPRRASLIKLLALPLTAIFARIFLQEQLSLAAWVGMGLTMAGVIWVITERTTIEESYSWKSIGTAAAFVAACTEAVGALLARYAFTHFTISTISSTFLRILGGLLIIIIWTLFKKGSLTSLTKRDYPRHAWAAFATAAFFGTYIGIWLQQTAFQLTMAGIVQTLLSTTQLFILLFFLISGKEKITLRAIFGALIGMAGVILLFY